jgi:hypothetical protein
VQYADDDEEAEDSEDEMRKRAGAERIEVELDDIKDDDEEDAAFMSKAAALFTIKESNDRGLADMETGSEVYMSELLVREFFNKFRLGLIWKSLMRLKNKMKKICLNWEINLETSI